MPMSQMSQHLTVSEAYNLVARDVLSFPQGGASFSPLDTYHFKTERYVH